MSSGTGGSLNAGVGADGGGGHRSACLTGLLRPVVEHLLLPCWALRLPALSFLSPSPLGSQSHGAAPPPSRAPLCLQLDPSAPPHLFVELPLIATEFAAGIRDGGWRISLECLSLDDVTAAKPLLEATEVWKVSLNGMKAGLATRPQMTEREARLLEVTRTVSTGAGILPPIQRRRRLRGCKYLRGSFDRVVGSPDSESYYLVDPDGDLSHVLSFFFYRWRR
ncbi:unnamed protein product [Spirodela intermedia]|uniref:Uncharacterized protein n=1 Tax=Spirodela intermedia TaxID=51605 RepID=A0A7I8IIQ1_SPIIN|nr:unnamed protein product [Spirodela intermedia]CAA6657723.1 unnamed protein product [Spirodela intermedia]